MGSDDAKRFREEQRRSAQRGSQTRRTNNTNQRGNNNNKVIPMSRYTAPKGTAHKKRRLKPSAKLLALLLAASIGIGSFVVLGNISKAREDDKIQTITQLEEAGVDINNIGLASDTVDLLEHYDEYFADLDENDILNLTDNDVIAIAEDIRSLNFNTIKDKVAELKGVDRSDVTLRYSFEKGDGSYHTAVVLNEDEYDRESYTNSTGYLFGLGKHDSIPQEISDLILKTSEYDDIINDLKADRITKRNALNRLQELYRTISDDIVTKEFTLDGNDNIVLQEYNTEKTIDQDQEKGGEEI